MDMSADPMSPLSQARVRAKGARRKVVPTYKLRQAQRGEAARESARGDPSEDELPFSIEVDGAETDRPAGQPEEGSPASLLAIRRHVRLWLERAREDGFRQEQVRKSALPYLAVCLPVLATSIFAPLWLSWAMSWISLIALFRVAQTLDETAFSVGIRRGFLAYAIPVNVLLAAWSSALALADRHAIIPTTAFAHVALLCLLIAPTCRWNRERTQRRLPLRWTYPVVASAVAVAQGLMVFKDLGWT